MNPDPYIRPSALEAISLCPGRPIMEAAVVARFGTPPVADEASTGTVVHAAVAAALLGLAEPVGCASLNGWDRYCIGLCVEFARGLIAKHAIEDGNVLVEQHLDGLDLGLVNGGSADLVLVDPYRHLVIVDWKTGHLDQGDATDHDQLAAYAIMGAATFKVQKVTVYIYQPRAERDRRISGATFDAATLKANETWVRSVTAAAREPNPELHASLAACGHCKALARCAEARRHIMESREALSLIGDPLDADAWGELIGAGKTAEAFAEQAKDIAKAHLQGGGQATGFGLQPGRTLTRIDSAKAIELARAGGVLETLLPYAKFGAEAADVIPAIQEAVSLASASPSIKAIKSKRGAA